MKWKYLALPILLVLPVIASCTPEQIAIFEQLNPEQQTAVVNHIRSTQARQASTSSRDCYEAVDKYWPESSRSWIKTIIRRESNNTPTAQNSSSSAAGCLQILRIHAPRFTKLGYSWSDRYNPDVNILVGLDLYREAGASPWRLTNY